MGSGGGGAAGTGGAVGGGAAAGVLGAPDGAARTGGGTGVIGGGEVTHPTARRTGTAAVMVAGGKDCTEAGAQARTPPRPLAGSGVKSPLYLAFSASESAFQRWPWVDEGRGRQSSGCGTRDVGRGSYRRGRGRGRGRGTRNRGNRGRTRAI